MLNSVRYLLSAPFNKKYPLFAFYRFLLWKFIRIFKITNYKFSIWNNRKALIHFDSIQSMWFMYNYWIDWEEFNLLKDLLKEDDVVFDVGSNVGFYTLWMSKSILNGKIHSFEPDNKNFSRLEQNIQLNNIKQTVQLNKLGVSDKTGIVYLTQNGDVLNHVVFEKSPDTIEISSVTLDDYCYSNNIIKIKYLKIDIEGFEMNAFQGGTKMLADGNIDVIQFEVNNAIANSGGSEMGLINYLQLFGYKLASYDVSNKMIQKVSYTKERENYFAVKNIEKLNDILRLNKTSVAGY